jgi:ApbE superfamily uncharacterized protein (UPF0280 family)
MSYEQSIAFSDEETVLAECGPMRLAIRAWQNGRPQIDLCREAAQVSFAYLEMVAAHRAILAGPVDQADSMPENKLARRMVQSVVAVGETDLTPMAAVAGTIADAVADWLFKNKTTKVIVDNGGDIAIRLAAGENATVGIRPQIDCFDISHVAQLDDRSPSWGVTTSGMGGRSLTRGIASAVTVIADHASIADAAATSIANACFVADDSIVQVPAEQLDPGTDIKGIDVTVDVGTLSRSKMRQAARAALSHAEALCRQQLIIGALVALDDLIMMTDRIKELISPSKKGGIT